MKRLIGGLFAAFAIFMGATIYISHRSWDGLVDRRYSETAANEFAEREAEARAGFKAVLPDRYLAGKNRFRAVLSTSAGPLRGALVLGGFGGRRGLFGRFVFRLAAVLVLWLLALRAFLLAASATA